MTRCCQCKRNFVDLNLHLDLVHSNKREKWCKHCGRLFSKKSHMKKHVNTKQCDGAGHRCYVCNDDKFNSAESFSCHLESHESLHVYGCRDCERTFMLRNNYNQHLSLVHDTMIVSVDELLENAENCTLSEEYSALFLDGVEKVEESDDYCTECRRCFPQIKIHRALAHSDKPQVVCHLCGRQFLKMKRLESHLSEHCGNTIKCHVCDRDDFENSEAFCRHLEGHESLRVLPCSFCSKVFVLKLNLDKHLRKKHKDFTVLDCKSEFTVSGSEETNRIQSACLPENANCRIHFADSTEVQENATSQKERHKTKKRIRENSFTNCGTQEINVSSYPSLSEIVKEESEYLEEYIQVKEEKKEQRHEISSSPIRKRKNSSSSPIVLSESSCNSSVRPKKKKKKNDKDNLLNLINQSSENVISLLDSDEEESVSLVKKNKKNKRDKENSLSPIKKSSGNVISLSESNEEESSSSVKKNKKNKSNKEFSSGLTEKHSSVILSLESDNEESSNLPSNIEKSRKNKKNKEKDICDKYSRNALKDTNVKSNSGDKTFDSRKLRESKFSETVDDVDSRISDSDGDCLSDSSQSSIVDKTCFKCGSKFPNMYEVHVHYYNKHNHLSMGCQKCSKVYKTYLNVYCHAMKHSDAYPWKCKRCGLKLKTKTYYRRHMLSVHLHKKKYKCPHCYEVFIYHSPFIAHVMLHDDETQFSCSHCKKLFRYKKLIEPHQETIECKECGITLPCKTLFERHVEDKHPFDSLFVCPHCANQYQSRTVLRRHITNKHFESIKKDAVYCKMCSYFTHCKYNLNRHVRNNHM